MSGAALTYLVGEMSNGAAKLRDTHPRGIGRCYVERPIRPFDSEPWFLDNGVFRVFNANGRDISSDYTDCYANFETKLEEASVVAKRSPAMFIVAPDRPGDPDSIWTSVEWILEYQENGRQAELDPQGWYYGGAHGTLPVYLAIQDGMTPELLESIVDVETDDPLLSMLGGLFIGGTDSFKEVSSLKQWRELANRWGLRLHFGRCTQSRLQDAVDSGCDSADSAHPIRLAGRRWTRFLEVFDNVIGWTA